MWGIRGYLLSFIDYESMNSNRQIKFIEIKLKKMSTTKIAEVHDIKSQTSGENRNK